MTNPTLHTFTSNGYQATISTLGAELKSLTMVSTGEEYIWHGDPAIWKGTAPVLFPIVGRLKDGQYQHNGKSYSLDKHGFARNSVFTLQTDKADEKSFLLKSNTETFKQYPFEFEFEVFFSLSKNGLAVRYEVRNMGDEAMLFTLGSHPAFALPLNNSRLEDYYLAFEMEEQLDCYFLQNDLLCTKPIPGFLNNSKIIPVSAELFQNDALIFKNVKSRTVSIHHKKNGRRLKLDLGQAHHLGIWAKAGAPFICLEPWFSYDDTHDVDGNLMNKPGILSLSKHETFSTYYDVII